MINYLKFEKLDNIELIELSNNTIVLFNTKEALQEFKSEFEKLIEDNNYKYVYFSTDTMEATIRIEKKVICRDISGIYNVNKSEQRIILTVEPISILLLETNHDLWLIDKDENNKLKCFAFSEYENHKAYPNKEDVYKFICKSKYGCNMENK